MSANFFLGNVSLDSDNEDKFTMAQFCLFAMAINRLDLASND